MTRLSTDDAVEESTVRPAFVVAIDGPAGAGKTTVAREVARRLDGFRYLDTGAMYRAVTAWVLRFDKLEGSDEELAEAAEGLEDAGGRWVVHGTDVHEDIRSTAVTGAVSRVSAVPLLRRVVQRKQREQSGRIVVEGRDIGSVVFPDAPVKVFLSADLDERARRRSREDPSHDAARTAELIARRDTLDSTRSDSPLMKAEGATEIDTTELSIEEVVERVLVLVERRLQAGIPAPEGAAEGPAET